MRFKKIGVSKSIAAACLIFVLGDVTQATVVLDQSADPGPPDTAYFVRVAGEYSGQDVAQTFVPAVSGTLSSLDLLLDHIGPQEQPQPILVDIRSAPGGVPQLNDSPVLGSALVDWSQIPEQTLDFLSNPVWTNVDLSTADISVTAGVPLAIVLSSQNALGRYEWICSAQGDDVYASGSTWIRPGGTNDPWSPRAFGSATTDQAFREYVSTPEPTAILLAWLISLLLLCGRSSRNICSMTTLKAAAPGCSGAKLPC